MLYNTGLRRWTAVSILISIPIVSMGQSWESQLQDGSRIRVDPNTNRGMVVTPDGARTQLWDGVHRLQDGSEITVRSGVVVPNKAILESRPGLPPARPLREETGASPCRKLELLVCGPGDECAAREACSQARQLVRFEREEKEDRVPGFEQAPQQCRDALQLEDYFKPCLGSSSPCQELVVKVCGTGGECAAGPACEPARQLLEMEKQERLSSLDPSSGGFSAGQCRKALQDDEFFAACAR